MRHGEAASSCSGDLQVATSAVKSLGLWRRRRNRLAPESYLGPHAYFVTCTTAGRSPHFRDEKLVESCRSTLAATSKVEEAQVLAYVFMPDHLHLLLLASDTTMLPRFMKRFKQDTGYWFKQDTGESLWQKGDYDHVVRDDEDLNTIALYIAANPVRAGLAAEWILYPFVGGDLLNEARDGDLKVAATPRSGGPVPPIAGSRRQYAADR